MSMLRSIAMAASMLLASAVAVSAQAPATAPPPAGMSQEQFDSLVDAISNSVTEKLKAEGGLAAPPPPSAAQPKTGKGAPAVASKPIAKPAAEEGPDEFAIFLDRAEQVALGTPVLGAELALIPGLLDQRSKGGRGAPSFVLLLGLIGAVAVAAEAGLRRILGRLRARLAAGAGPQQGMRSLINLGLLALLDGLGVLAVWLICHAAVGAWFSGGIGQDKLAAAVLMGIFSWRLYVLLFRILLQPDMPKARLCDVRDPDARAMYMRISVVMLLFILGRILGQVLLAIGTPPAAFAAFQVIGGLIYLAGFVWLVVRSKEAARQWFGGLGVVAPLVGALGRHWVPVATSFFVVLAATQVYGAVSGRVHVSSAMVLTLTLVIGLLIFETLLQAFVRRLDSQLVGRTPASNSPKLPDVVARCVRVAVLIGVGVMIAESWVVEVLGLANETEWAHLTRSSTTAGITLFLAFVLWELFKYATEPYMERKSSSAGGSVADPAAGSPASRLSTMMPLMRMAAAIVICVVAVLVALADIGVNITPLIAGASVFGLAVSFGSQTLVKDIVSGIFYLSDDAFRVGEYIDCGKAKGTVEGFTLRSIKLRHQNGQVHTIPFGELGQITNFSRDWTTVKFNLRFTRDTNLATLRQAAKKIGTDMLEIPEIKSEILEPFKMQGVADITDNALVIGFKFTAKPGNPAVIQREAIDRMFGAFPELGIEFAK
ncbi:MAG TPA: mechanosensitive ion channel family protein [Reyranella sp.]|jgi:small-conductance mechanosensitive channel|nr:mechanosensitive ion channel family protein [Reyranella sp.]